MQLENYYGEVECKCCFECMGITPPHCTHCPHYVQRTAAAIEDGYDYSHLVGDPGKQREKRFELTRFDELLTEYDRILLKFGMCILWD